MYSRFFTRGKRYMEDTGYCRSICRGAKQLIFSGFDAIEMPVPIIPGFDAIEMPIPIIPDSVIQYCRYTDG